MKINRLQIEGFAIEDYPTINKQNINGDDLLLTGGNRSGKTLTLNAILYSLYGPRATFGVQPGRQSEVEVIFDSGDRLDRGASGREYRHGGEVYDTEDVDIEIPSVIGPEEVVKINLYTRRQKISRYPPIAKTRF